MFRHRADRIALVLTTGLVAILLLLFARFVPFRADAPVPAFAPALPNPSTPSPPQPTPAGNWTQDRSEPLLPRLGSTKPMPSAREPLEDMRERARGAARVAADQWMSAGLPAPDVAALVDVSARTLSAVLTSDAEAYQTLMASLGMTRSSRGAAAARSFADWVGSPEDKARLASASDEALIDWAWGAVDARAARVIAVDAHATTAGQGWLLPQEEMKKGGPQFFSVYEPSEDIWAIAQAAADGDLPSVWIQVPIRFAQGDAFALRITLVRPDPSGVWLPVRADLRGQGSHIPLLMF